MALDVIIGELRKLANPLKAAVLKRFFKTGPGEYGEGDLFLGIQVPDLRKLAKRYQSLSTCDLVRLLKSRIHEERLLALLILVRVYAKGTDAVKKRVVRIYLDHRASINNWDLVDLSAPNILGDFLLARNKKPLYALARSAKLWERRMAILATFRFIRERQFVDTLRISRILLADKEDLIHKAVGWMLREVGKRDGECEEQFLRAHYRQMPRTMLRYAIERFPARKRRCYLTGRVKKLSVKPVASRRQ